ncbi:twin-arginine translocase TatA/TatE family subunit [Niveispirillum fermenti]|uniref:twin-arginine translocase TatA/TatE family subunit n=1 Tax=Niveispirillum fermenti TaxID=1233113 RepID=UPI003A8B47DD
MGAMSLWHWIIVLVVVLLVFGAGKLPNVMGDMAKGVKAFKKGMRDEDAAPESDPKLTDAKPGDNKGA